MTDARQAAQAAADAIRKWLADPASGGVSQGVHIRMARPRRGVWLTTWANLPGLFYDRGARTYSHVLLPGWCYTPAEMRTEMLDDLELFARTGWRPTEASTTPAQTRLPL